MSTDNASFGVTNTNCEVLHSAERTLKRGARMIRGRSLFHRFSVFKGNSRPRHFCSPATPRDDTRWTKWTGRVFICVLALSFLGILAPDASAQTSVDENAAHCISLSWRWDQSYCFEDEEFGKMCTQNLTIKNSCNRGIRFAGCLLTDGAEDRDIFRGLYWDRCAPGYGFNMSSFLSSRQYRSAAQHSWSYDVPLSSSKPNVSYGACFHIPPDYHRVVDHNDGTYSCKPGGTVYTASVSGETSDTAVCDRTPQVRDALVQSLPSPPRNCRNVTDAHLASIDLLHLSDQGITALKVGDFAGLSSLTTLNLTGNELTTLPLGLFSRV